MKKFLAVLVLSALASFAHAGVGLSAKAIVNLANGDFLASAIGGGLGAASLSAGINRVQNGSVGWGVFFIVLEEQEVISAKDRKNLDNADVATKETFLDIIGSEKSEDEKQAELAAL